MTKRIFRSIFLVSFLLLLTCIVLTMSILYGYFNQAQQQQIQTQTELVAEAVVTGGAAYLSAVPTDEFRITWIGADGSVLYDTDIRHEEMENHLDREEVREALESGYGESERYSNTMTTKMIYTAELLPDGTILRVSTERYSLFSFILLMLQPIAAMFLAAAVVSGLLAGSLSKRIVQPLNRLDLDDPLSNDTYEEISPLLTRIDRQHRQIGSQVEALQHKQEEFDAVITGMSEGLALLNADGTILTMNRAAAELLGVDRAGAVGRDILTINHSLPMQELLRDARDGRRRETSLQVGGREYQLAANPVVTGGQSSGVVLLILDVTEKTHAEQLRREFAANVSHELKTPLHSISGCAELLKNGLVRPEDTARFVGQIYDEAQRLISLVEDIIRLSRLDEGAEDMVREPVDLLEAARDVTEQLVPYAVQKHVTLSCGGDRAVITGVPRLITEILSNLCDNAIKYNVEGGSVAVVVSRVGDFCEVQVQDTGIGIPPEHQSRVFERFYRVDKSHSREIGGTGLGLSIVKHAAMVHNAAITLDSTPGQGTIITVRFPK